MIEDPILRIESFAIINLRGVSTNYILIWQMNFPCLNSERKSAPTGL